jgi:phosphoglycolate phosphatase-like HAD superfamily hydrolase
MHNLHIFDCDGVLLDSNTAKVEALRDVFISIGAPIPFVNWAVEEFRTNFGRPRKQHFDKFRLYAGIDGFQLSPAKSLQAYKKYSESVEFLYGYSNVIEETLSFILELSANDQIFVVSASDQSELQKILPTKIHILKKENIFGGPTTKLKNIHQVMEIANTKNAIFYGDAVQDAKASLAAGIAFIGLSKYAADSSALELFCAENQLNCISSL